MFFKGYPSITLCRFSDRCHSSSIPFCLQKWSSIGKNGQNFVGCQFGFIQIGSIKLWRIHQITKGFQYSIQYFIYKIQKVRDLVARKELFRAHDNLGVICSLLIGDKGTFKKYFDLYRPNWFEVFPAFILFFYPNADGRQMPKIAEVSLWIN